MSWIARFRRRRRQRVLEQLTPVRSFRVLTGGSELTRDDVIQAMNLWAIVYGEPPTYTSWSRARATSRNDMTALTRMGEPGDWPTSRQVVRRFGSWSAALEASGFEPRPAHRPRSIPLQQFDGRMQSSVRAVTPLVVRHHNTVGHPAG